MKITIIFTSLLICVQSNEYEQLLDIQNDLQKIYEGFSARRGFSLDPSIYNNAMMTPEEDLNPILSNSYDFIIVGAGAAGSVIASRLSEIRQWKVLLLEAGKKENAFSEIPLFSPALQFTHYNWRYFAEYQQNVSTGLNNDRMHWPRGRALGGTSVINYMIYTRGNRHDYNRWAAIGNPGWSYEEVLPYFIKSERANLQYADLRYHGIEGKLSVENIYQSKLVEAFVKSGQYLGLPHIDYNANTQSFGVARMQATVLNGRRHSAAKAFLNFHRNRPNLSILTSAYVTKILINPITRKTYGVEYTRFGKKYRVQASKEVILSAGAFNSPQLLMLAGIGPAPHLQELGIPVLENLPVGQNLHDHLTFPGLSFLIDKELSLSAYKLLNLKSLSNFFINGTGPYTSLGGVEGIGYIKTELSQDPDDIPDIELLFVGASLSTDYGLVTRVGMNIKDEVYNSLFAPTHNIPNWTIFPMLLHPKSIGYLKLRSRNPFDYPLFYGNYFTDPEDQDLNTFVASIRFIQQIAKTPPFQAFGSKLNPNRQAGCEMFEFNSDDYWRCCVRALAVTLHHQVGTAKMGPPDDPTSVVNNELKVYGINGLRVADCSVVPFAVGAHTNAVSIMVGEKASDIIKENWVVL